MNTCLVIDGQGQIPGDGIHLERSLKWRVYDVANRFDLFVNGVILCYDYEKVGLEDGSSVADAMWEMIWRWKRTVVASLPMDLNLTD